MQKLNVKSITAHIVSVITAIGAVSMAIVNNESQTEKGEKVYSTLRDSVLVQSEQIKSLQEDNKILRSWIQNIVLNKSEEKQKYKLRTPEFREFRNDKELPEYGQMFIK